ncbi:MAG: hypothetical protein V3V29_03550 [Acidimicrobiia bacterium]
MAVDREREQGRLGWRWIGRGELFRRFAVLHLTATGLVPGTNAAEPCLGAKGITGHIRESLFSPVGQQTPDHEDRIAFQSPRDLDHLDRQASLGAPSVAVACVVDHLNTFERIRARRKHQGSTAIRQWRALDDHVRRPGRHRTPKGKVSINRNSIPGRL